MSQTHANPQPPATSVSAHIAQVAPASPAPPTGAGDWVTPALLVAVAVAVVVSVVSAALAWMSRRLLRNTREALLQEIREMRTGMSESSQQLRAELAAKTQELNATLARIDDKLGEMSRLQDEFWVAVARGAQLLECARRQGDKTDETKRAFELMRSMLQSRGWQRSRSPGADDVQSDVWVGAGRKLPPYSLPQQFLPQRQSPQAAPASSPGTPQTSPQPHQRATPSTTPIGSKPAVPPASPATSPAVPFSPSASAAGRAVATRAAPGTVAGDPEQLSDRLREPLDALELPEDDALAPLAEDVRDRIRRIAEVCRGSRQPPNVLVALGGPPAEDVRQYWYSLFDLAVRSGRASKENLWGFWLLHVGNALDPLGIELRTEGAAGPGHLEPPDEATAPARPALFTKSGKAFASGRRPPAAAAARSGARGDDTDSSPVPGREPPTPLRATDRDPGTVAAPGYHDGFHTGQPVAAGAAVAEPGPTAAAASVPAEAGLPGPGMATAAAIAVETNAGAEVRPIPDFPKADMPEAAAAAAAAAPGAQDAAPRLSILHYLNGRAEKPGDKWQLCVIDLARSLRQRHPDSDDKIDQRLTPILEAAITTRDGFRELASQADDRLRQQFIDGMFKPMYELPLATLPPADLERFKASVRECAAQLGLEVVDDVQKESELFRPPGDNDRAKFRPALRLNDSHRRFADGVGTKETSF